MRENGRKNKKITFRLKKKHTLKPVHINEFSTIAGFPWRYCKGMCDRSIKN